MCEIYTKSWSEPICGLHNFATVPKKIFGNYCAFCLFEQWISALITASGHSSHTIGRLYVRKYLKAWSAITDCFIHFHLLDQLWVIRSQETTCSQAGDKRESER